MGGHEGGKNTYTVKYNGVKIIQAGISSTSGLLHSRIEVHYVVPELSDQRKQK